MDLVGIEDVEVAAHRIAGLVVRTPLLSARWAREGSPLELKPESLQPTGAFKLRGASNAVARLDAEARARGVVTHSSGNHAQALAWAARAVGVRASIVMPEGASPTKIEATRALGAEVVLVPAAERESAADQIAARRGAVVVSPYDHRDVIAGQGTVGLEIVADRPDADTVLVPASGGGLVAGVAVALKARRPQARVIAVEPELAGDLAESMRRGERVRWSEEQSSRTIADGLRVTQVGALPWEHIRVLVDEVMTVSEEEIRAAMRLLAHGSCLVVEPSGAVAVAAYLSCTPARRLGRTVAVVSGGNVEPALLREVLGADLR